MSRCCRIHPALPPIIAVSSLFLASAPEPAMAQAPPVTARPPQFGVSVEKNVPIITRDKVRLAADIYHPARDGKPVAGRYPALLTRTPYNKDGAARDGQYYAERGYVVVLNDVRGRYASEGTWRLIVDDPQDGYDVVEWIARRSGLMARSAPLARAILAALSMPWPR